MIYLGLTVDDITVFEKGFAETWSSAMFRQGYLKKKGDQPAKSCSIDMLDTITEVANEFFAALNSRETSPTGFEKFSIRNLKGIQTLLEESVLEELSDKLS